MSSEFKKLAGSFIAPSIIVAMMFAVKIYEVVAHISLADDIVTGKQIGRAHV